MNTSDDFDCSDWLLYVVSTYYTIVIVSVTKRLLRLIHPALALGEVLFMVE